MSTKSTGASAFDQGQSAGKDLAGPHSANPFPEGSAEHNNFEVGRRFGAANAVGHVRPTAAAMKPDADEDAG